MIWTWIYAIAAVLLFALVLAGALLIALRATDWQDTEEDYDDDGLDAGGNPDADR